MSWLITPGQPVPLDPSRSNVSLLLHGNGTNGSTTITDSSPTPKTVTAVGNAQISTAQSKFGGASIAFDENGDYLTLASNPNLALGSGDFTIEMWVYSTATGVTQNFLDARASSTGYAVQKNSSNEITFYSEVAGSFIVNAALTANQWVHVAIVRSSGTITLYLDGTSADTGANTSNYTSQIAVIGARFSKNQQYYTGYIDDLRITKGIARYTANFTPPAAQFPDI